MLNLYYFVLIQQTSNEGPFTSASTLNSQNQNNITNQSAGNESLFSVLGSSETKRALSDNEWLAGIIDGGGNFDIRVSSFNRVLKSIRIKLSARDGRILYRIKDLLKTGSVRPTGRNLLVYAVSHREGMLRLVNMVNGHIRIKLPGFIDACRFLNINYLPASFTIPANSDYLAGLVDTDGSVVFNYPGNRIELHLEFKQNELTSTLDFSQVIGGVSPTVYRYIKKNQSYNKVFYSIRFSYACVSYMSPLFNYFKRHRCYSDFKFYRLMQIKKFLELREFKNYPFDSAEFRLYNDFVKRFYTHMNEHKPLPKYIR